MSGMSFSKQVVQSLIEVYGKDQAIEEMTGACRAWIEMLVEEAMKDLEEK